MAKIVLINPRFSVSFWSMTHSLDILGREAMVPTAALSLLAALTPPEHEVRLLDEAVEPLDWEAIAGADLVGLTGMIVQRERMREIATQVKALGKFLVVGGPWITVQEDYLAGLADVVFVGEADQTWPQFLAEWAEGNHPARYEQAERTDMTTLPAPRLDLLKLDGYLQGSVQVSRGCPFLCEFCDIIVTFGRQPRVKAADQVIAELDEWRRAGFGSVFLVDDNLIGNRKALLPILDRIAAWQREHRYIVSLHTEASLNLADDAELLERFVAANIRTVFVGIESPNPAALLETRKFQNVDRRQPRGEPDAEAAASFILDRIHRIQGKGIKVTCGLILGFDSDTPDIFESHRRFIAKTGILQVMVGLLAAIPKTPLYERLRREGRLDEEDFSAFGTNVVPVGMGREQLTRGFLDLIAEVYEPAAYFDRLDDLYIRRRFYDHAEAVRVPNIPRWLRAKYLLISWSFTSWLLVRLLWRVEVKDLRGFYLKRLLNYVSHRPYPMRVLDYVMESVCHYHFYRFSRDMAQGRTGVVNTM
ncbi:Radical SAM superfamily enzyme YgiQ, UPF0313 family [Methylomagnum ishizawai]|uniref:Radical SAM superfamily enzyme YgiQ, UPF0313 family n=1 Tax=Methylomagnum ishizawai TaxID=1760988 RepID=A0A1Y6CVS1_9GAMM|nr:DUF4070 domain-containing protein [Methylomagnum ishizawai]SMF94386.1 Radical SAM superfamily enzyme YgiQ, UPF0313 family [Methylomagnum ishizawai]